MKLIEDANKEAVKRILEGEPQAAVALRRLVATRVGRVLNDLDVVRPLFEEAGEDYR